MLDSLQLAQVLINLSAAIVYLIISAMLVEILRTANKTIFTRTTLVVLSTACFAVTIQSFTTVIPLTLLFLGLGFLHITWKVFKNRRIVMEAH